MRLLHRKWAQRTGQRREGSNVIVSKTLFGVEISEEQVDG